MNILLITSLLILPNSAHREIVGGTIAISDLVKYWTREHNVLCIREVTFGLKRYIKYRIDKLRGHKTILDDIPDKYILDGIVTYPIMWEYTHFFQLTGGYLNHYMDGKINRILKQNNFVPDVIISHMPSYSVAYYIRRISADVPRVAVLHSDIHYLMADVGILHGKTISKMRSKSLDEAFDCIYTRSYSIYKNAKELGLKHLSDGIVTSGVPSYLPDIQREWTQFVSKKVKILYAGSLIERKGVQQVLKALAALNSQFHYEFLIIGGGYYETYLHELTGRLGLTEHVFFLGEKSRNEVMQYMLDSDIFITPSHHETFGLVYLEAMAMGCITIGSKGEGIDGIIVDGQNGFLVDPYDVEDIAGKLQQVIHLTVEEIREIGTHAMEIVNTHAEEKVSEHYMDLIKKAIS